MIIQDWKKAADSLRNGELVSLPTETVYGLAASIEHPKAIEQIFEKKKRPKSDPLIVHVNSIEMAKSLIDDWNDIHSRLGQLFWPGPLTIVSNKSASVSSSITAGLPKVAVRWSKHALLQQVIDELGHPIVAPSANLFGKVSPTSAKHVASEFDDICILDGGECSVGIESTVLAVGDKNLEILRPGPITAAALTAMTEWDTTMRTGETDSGAPGQTDSHYQPQKPLFIVPERTKEIELPPAYSDLKIGVELELDDDPFVAARGLYRLMRKYDQSSANYIYVRKDSEKKGHFWVAIWDRLERAGIIIPE